MVNVSLLDHRVLQPELMDDPVLDPAEHRRALAGLRKVNRASGTAGELWRRIEPLARGRDPSSPLRVLDIATGSGDVPLEMGRIAAARGVPAECDGCDFSPRAVEEATAQAGAREQDARGRAPRFFVLDVLRDELPGGYDVLTCSLFMHHLATEDVVRVLAKMSAAARWAVLVSDLRRCRAGYGLAWAATRLFSRSHVVRTDALLSVRAAFTIEEFAQLARRAGLQGARLERAWPCRFFLHWRRA